jgi:hypothetical protein
VHREDIVWEGAAQELVDESEAGDAVDERPWEAREGLEKEVIDDLGGMARRSYLEYSY